MSDPRAPAIGFRFSSLRIRLLLLILLAILPALALTLYGASEQRRHEGLGVQEKLLRIARQASAEEERLIEGARLLLVTLAHLPQVSKGDPAACNQILANLLTQFPFYVNLAAAKSRGDIFCSDLPSPGRVTLADRDYFRRTLETEDFTVSEYLFDPAGRKAHLVLAYPSIDDLGVVRTVVVVGLDVTWVNQFLAKARLPQGSTLSVRNPSGTILFRYPDPENWIGRTVPETPQIKSMLVQHGEGAAEASGLDGVPRLYGFRRLGGGSYLRIGIPTAVAFAAVNRALTRNLVWLGLVAALALAAAWLSADLFIARPVGALMAAAKRLRAGDLTTRTGLPHGPGELGQLASTFDQMAESLEQREVERRQAEAALDRLRRHNELILDAVGEGVYGVDLQGNLTFLNPAAERVLGWKFEELAGRPMHALVHHTKPDGTPHPREECFVYAALKDGAVRHVDSEVYWRRDGTCFPVEYVSTPIWEGENLVGAVATFKDITGRKRAEEALRQQLARISLLNQIARAIADRQDLDSIFRVVLRHLEDHLPVDLGAVFCSDAHANVMTVAACGPKSRSVAAQLGLGEGAVMPAEETGLRPGRHGEMVYFHDTAQTEAPLLHRLTQGGIRSGVAAPLVVEDHVSGFLLVGRCGGDGFSSAERTFLQRLSEHVALASYQAGLHSELREAYDDLRRTQQAVMQQERLRALGQMASGIVHDINNALSPVLGFTDLLLVMDELRLSDRAKRYLQYVKNGAMDMAHMVAGLREFYRQREKDEELLAVDLNHLVQEVVDLTRPRWKDIPQERGVVITIATNVQEELPVVLGVEGEVREALTNLILNAVDAMPSGGAVTLRTRVGAPGRVALEVIDTGVGMDEQTRRHCLEPFFTTKGDRGTGLGLAMVYGVMQRHGGDIEIESEVGRGTTVRLIFLVRAPGEAAISASAEAPPSVTNLRVLCIDDEPVAREVLKDMLENDGHTVELAGGGQAGLDAIQAATAWGAPFDVVITDLGMPYVDGRQVAETVKRESPTTPVILLTGWGSRLKVEGDLPAHVDSVVGKPLMVTELRQALARVRAGGKVAGDSPPSP